MALYYLLSSCTKMLLIHTLNYLGSEMFRQQRVIIFVLVVNKHA